MAHQLYKTGDKNIPSGILDRNGEVVLDLCKYCGKAEAELIDDECITTKKEEYSNDQTAADDYLDYLHDQW